MYVCCLSCFSLLFFFNIYIHSNASNIFCFFSSGICGRCIYSFALYTPFICLLLWTKNTREKKRKKKESFKFPSLIRAHSGRVYCITNELDQPDGVLLWKAY